MQSLNLFFDKRSPKTTLNQAITLLVVASCDFIIGLFMTIKYLLTSDGFGFYMGIANAAIGIIGIFYASQLIHAVVRRLTAASRIAL